MKISGEKLYFRSDILFCAKIIDLIVTTPFIMNQKSEKKWGGDSVLGCWSYLYAYLCEKEILKALLYFLQSVTINIISNENMTGNAGQAVTGNI